MKKILITGGTGTVGRAFIAQYYHEYEFYTLSRNEAKIADLIKEFDKVTTFVGDVTNYELLSTIIGKIKPDIIIHGAALKHVDISQKNPISAILNNVIGSYNIIKAAINHDVSLTIGISTDKACNPENIYGYTKKLMEEMFLDSHTEKNRFICTRFANVAGSNGSVIPFWKSLVKNGNSIKLTDEKMNRLMFSKKEAAELIYRAIQISDKETSESFILSKKMKSVNLLELAKCMSNIEIEIVGLRHGEKLNEDLISSKEIKYTKILGDYIAIKNTVQVKEDNIKTEYSSITAEKISLEEMKQLIREN